MGYNQFVLSRTINESYSHGRISEGAQYYKNGT